VVKSVRERLIRIAHLTLAPLGTTLASTLFAVALLASGQSSTITAPWPGSRDGRLHALAHPTLDTR